jgi:GT2 family glycosyltransferase
VPTLSIVICTKDRAEDMRRTLASIESQSILPDEVVVVDSSADGQVKEVVVRSSLPTLYIHSDPGITRQRNKGVTASSGDILVFLDDDVELVTGCLQAFLESLRQNREDVAAICGRVLNVLPRLDSKTSQFLYAVDKAVQRFFMMPEERHFGYFKYSTASTRPHLSDKPGYTQVLSGGCSAYWKSVFEVIHFDEYFEAYGYAEDVDTSLQISNAGHKIYYEPRAALYHYPSGTSRIPRRDSSRMLVKNSYYIYCKHFENSWLRTGAIFWSFFGFAVSAFLHRDYEALRGTLTGIREIFTERGNRDRYLTS